MLELRAYIQSASKNFIVHLNVCCNCSLEGVQRFKGEDIFIELVPPDHSPRKVGALIQLDTAWNDLVFERMVRSSSNTNDNCRSEVVTSINGDLLVVNPVHQGEAGCLSSFL